RDSSLPVNEDPPCTHSESGRRRISFLLPVYVVLVIARDSSSTLYPRHQESYDGGPEENSSPPCRPRTLRCTTESPARWPSAATSFRSGIRPAPPSVKRQKPSARTSTRDPRPFFSAPDRFAASSIAR